MNDAVVHSFLMPLDAMQCDKHVHVRTVTASTVDFKLNSSEAQHELAALDKMTQPQTHTPLAGHTVTSFMQELGEPGESFLVFQREQAHDWTLAGCFFRQRCSQGRT